MDPSLTKLPENRSPPRPGPVLVFVSLVVIGFFLLLTTVGLIGLLDGRDPFSALGAVGMIGCGAYFAWIQYRATFKAQTDAAAQVTAGLKIGVVVLAILMVFLIFVTVSTSAPRAILGFALFGALAILIFSVFAAVQSQQWWLQLVAAGLPADDRAARRFTLQDAFFASIALALTLAGSSYMLRHWQPRLVEHMPPQHCPFEFPTGASDVSFCIAPSGQVAYEFTVDASGAREWAESLDFLSLPPIRSELYMPTVYYWERSYWQRAFARGERDSLQRITQGWAVEGYVDGKQVQIAYDQPAQRAYYFTTSP